MKKIIERIKQVFCKCNFRIGITTTDADGKTTMHTMCLKCKKIESIPMDCEDVYIAEVDLTKEFEGKI